jgi:hypothetical protein
MKKAQKLTGILALLALCACASDKPRPVDCSTVRCAACPTGQHPALTPPDCCRCIPD